MNPITIRSVAARALADGLEKALAREIADKGADSPEGTVFVEVSATLMREIISTLKGEE